MSYSGNDSNHLIWQHLLLNQSAALELLPLEETSRSVETLNYPRSYVDAAAPFSHPCTPDGVLEKNSTGTDCKVYVFHHLYIANNWRPIVTDQLVKLVFSGLYDRASAVFSTVSGTDPASMEEAVQLLKSFGSKFTVLDQQLNSTQYERATLYQIKKHVTDKDLIYYFHSKGK